MHIKRVCPPTNSELPVEPLHHSHAHYSAYHVNPSSAFRPPANSKRSAEPLHHSRAHCSANHAHPSGAFRSPRSRTDYTKLNRLYGKALAVRCTSSAFACWQTRSCRSSHYITRPPIFSPTMCKPSSEFARRQTRSCRSSHYIIHTPIVPPTMRIPLARSARRQTLSGRQSHYIIHTPIIPPTMRKPSGAFRPPANSEWAAKLLHHSHVHYSAYHGTPQARLPVGKL